MPKQITQEMIDKEFLAWAKERFSHLGLNSQHVFERCNDCGNMEWSSCGTPDKQGFRTKIVDMTRECDRCREIRYRSPEIYRWVLNVIAHSKGPIVTEELPYKIKGE